MFAGFFALLYLLPIIIATDLSDRHEVDTFTYCGLQDNVKAGDYSLLLDQWGASHGDGYSCASLTSLSGTIIAWKNWWNWQGDSRVKSYTNIQLNKGLNQQLSAIKSMPTTWAWSHEASGYVVLDITYDIFTSVYSDGPNHNEIMIWVGNYNAGPISYSYDSYGKALPITRYIHLAGYTWDLFKGSNTENTVWSFVPSDDSAIPRFHADLNVFLKYLTESGHISSSEYLKTAQAGTEVTSGSGTLTSWDYSLAVY